MNFMPPGAIRPVRLTAAIGAGLLAQTVEPRSQLLPD